VWGLHEAHKERGLTVYGIGCGHRTEWYYLIGHHQIHLPRWAAIVTWPIRSRLIARWRSRHGIGR
jgi:hypothetical protein